MIEDYGAGMADMTKAWNIIGEVLVDSLRTIADFTNRVYKVLGPHGTFLVAGMTLVGIAASGGFTLFIVGVGATISSVGAAIVASLSITNILVASGTAIMAGLIADQCYQYFEGDGSSGSSNNGNNSENKSNKLTEKQKKDISDIAEKYDNLQCKEASQEIQKYLKDNNIKGEVIDFKSSSEFIVSDTYGTQAISENGTHQGVLVDGIVYDNIHPGGMSYSQWLNDLYSPGNINITITPIK